jgi:Domain of unknown function (DUF892)
LEQVFVSLEEKARGKHCDGIAGIIEEGKSIIEGDFDDTTMDACLIAAGQCAEHYEMAAYRTRGLGAGHGSQRSGASSSGNARREKAADEKLSGLAEGDQPGAAEAAHPDDEEEPAAVAAGAQRTTASKAKSVGRRRDWCSPLGDRLMRRRASENCSTYSNTSIGTDRVTGLAWVGGLWHGSSKRFVGTTRRITKGDLR